MLSCKLTEIAERDVAGIVDFIAAENRAAAEKLNAGLFHIFASIALLPHMGYIRADLAAPPVRFYEYRGYIIVYDSMPKPPVILRVISRYRDIAPLLKTR